MLNPLDIEQRYQNLLFALSQPSVSWQRAMRIIEFLDTLSKYVSRYDSYVLDALDHLYPVLKAAEPTALSPEELRHPLEVLDRTCGALRHLGNDERFAAARIHLRTVLCHSLMYVGDVRALVAALDERYATAMPPWLEDTPEELLRDRRAILLYVAPRISAADPFASGCMKELLAQWKDPLADEADVVRVPVVERGFGDISVEPHGVLRKVTLRITGSSATPGDHLETAIAVYGAETIGRSLVEAPVAAARQLLNATAPGLKRRSMTGVVTLDQHPALHEGDSAGLGIASLFYAAALRYANQRVVYHVRPNAAMTGVVDPDGTVRRVDAASLVPKTRAVFFSRIKTLVVPRDQLGPVEAEVERLKGRYPHRLLNVIGVGHLRDVFFDLRIIRQQIVPRSIHLVRGAWRHRSVLVPTVLIAALLVSITKVLVGPIDRNPAGRVFVAEHHGGPLREP